MRRVVLGTAGHIDHGKTSLVRLLTGVDTDRLKEERERGITIELGFTHLTLPGGTEVGFVDVPGHERFVRTMIAGASGIDLALLVIAADEGVMPQTREHLDICEVLGVRDGVVVLNKIDAVDPEMAELAAEEAAELTRGTFLDGRPVVRVSARTGAGKEALLARIAEAIDRVEERDARGPFRMSVDRVFSRKGFGTVVTGTAAGGRVRVGDTLAAFPGGATARVRGVQVHGRDADEALAGSRTALNLQGVEVGDVPRGSVLAAPGQLSPCHILDVELKRLGAAPAELRTRKVRFLCGTQEIVGKLVPLDEAAPMAQVRLEAPIAVRAGDRFVLRAYSPMTTLGGGRVVDPDARKRRPGRDAAAHLRALAGPDPADRARALIADAGGLGLPIDRLAARLPPGESESAGATARQLSREGAVELLDTAAGKDPALRAVDRVWFDRIAQSLLETLAALHRAEPSKPGLSRKAAVADAMRRARLGGPEAPSVGEAVLRRLEAAKKVASIGGEIKLPSHVPTLDAATSDLKPVLEAAYRDASLTPPTVKELQDRHPGRDRELSAVLAHLTRDGVLVKVSQDLFFHRDAMESIRQRLVAKLQAAGRITPLEFKVLAGNVSRKFMIPLLEHFDAMKVTMRVGEERVLRRPPTGPGAGG